VVPRNTSQLFGQSANDGICKPSQLATVGGYICGSQWHASGLPFDFSHISFADTLYILST